MESAMTDFRYGFEELAPLWLGDIRFGFFDGVAEIHPTPGDGEGFVVKSITLSGCNRMHGPAAKGGEMELSPHTQAAWFDAFVDAIVTFHGDHIRDQIEIIRAEAA
jgi:hypothetical protein